MATYEYRCKTCDDRFEVSRPMTMATPAVTPCPQGHTDTVKLLPSFATVGASAGGSSMPSMPSVPSMPIGGGGCGSGCGCAH